MKFCKKSYDINSVKDFFFFENGILIFFERVNWGRGPPLIFASGYFSALGGPDRKGTEGHIITCYIFSKSFMMQDYLSKIGHRPSLS